MLEGSWLQDFVTRSVLLTGLASPMWARSAVVAELSRKGGVKPPSNSALNLTARERGGRRSYHVLRHGSCLAVRWVSAVSWAAG